MRFVNPSIGMGIDRPWALIAFSLLVGTSIAADPPPKVATEQAEFFETKVRPVLAGTCLKCHGATKQSSGLRLDSREAILEGGLSGPAAVAGDPDKSLLIQVVRQTHEDIKMPPKGKLAEGEVDAISGWVKMGLPWPNEARSAAAGGSDASKTHWAFLPVKAVAPGTAPTIRADRALPSGPRFIVSRPGPVRESVTASPAASV